MHDLVATKQVETAKEHTVELYEDIYIVVPHCLSETSAGVHSNLQTHYYISGYVNVYVYTCLFSLVCNSACIEGLIRCHGLSDSDCCSYYSDNVCVDTCPDDLEPDGDFNCICTGFFVGPPTCQGLCVT